MKTKTTIETLNTLDQKLTEHNKLFFVRYGDGEIYTLMGKEHRNYKYSDALAKELKESFEVQSESYLKAFAVNIPFEKGMSKGVFANHVQNKELLEYLIKHGFASVDDVFESPICFQFLSVFKPKLVYNFISKHIRDKKKMFIGSTNQSVVEQIYGKLDHYVQIPEKHAYDTINNWWPQIEKNLSDIETVLPSAGAATNVIAARLWKMNVNINLLDIGSVLDALEQKTTRTWIRLVGHRAIKILPPEHRALSIGNQLKYIQKDVKYFFRQRLVR